MPEQPSDQSTPPPSALHDPAADAPRLPTTVDDPRPGPDGTANPPAAATRERYEVLRQRRSADDELPRFLQVFEQVCQTIAYAHSQRVLHRDLKPANIMVGEFGEVQVMDWGLAKVLGEPAALAAGLSPHPAANAAG